MNNFGSAARYLKISPPSDEETRIMFMWSSGGLMIRRSESALIGVVHI